MEFNGELWILMVIIIINGLDYQPLIIKLYYYP